VKDIAIHILGEFKDAPWGGGNQFLKALRNFFKLMECYTDRMQDADVIIVNGHQWGPYLNDIYKIKKRNPSVVILHRIDGPMSIVRGEDNQIIDIAIARFNKYFCDGTVFQSRWSKCHCINNGFGHLKFNEIILNAPDQNIFYKSNELKVELKKIRIVTTSWSKNWKKGFDILIYLDKNLDFTKYDLTFIGNTPVSFKNINCIQPLPSHELAQALRQHDIFLQTSQMEACSNSLIEAINCGLVPVARNNSSHPEIVGEGGVLYEGIEDAIEAINLAFLNKNNYLKKVNENIFMGKVGAAYKNFGIKIKNKRIKNPTFINFISTWVTWRISSHPGLFAKLNNLTGSILVKLIA
jgi:glycosyltransferase involved in cell wall biosynthesis